LSLIFFGATSTVLVFTFLIFRGLDQIRLPSITFDASQMLTSNDVFILTNATFGRLIKRIWTVQT